MVNMELKQIIFRSPSDGKTELRQNDELTRFFTIYDGHCREDPRKSYTAN